MTHTPKHRGEPVVKYRIKVVERERGWSTESWHEDFDTFDEADARYAEINARNTSTTAPDYYIQAEGTIQKITL